MSTAPTMPTIGEIARRLGEPVHRIEYVVRSRGIHPSGWAGNARVFEEETVDTIAQELQRIEALKAHNRHGSSDSTCRVRFALRRAGRQSPSAVREGLT